MGVALGDFADYGRSEALGHVLTKVRLSSSTTATNPVSRQHGVRNRDQ
jgi:hypothetical protein